MTKRIYVVIDNDDNYITVNDEVIAKKLKNDDNEILSTKVIEEL